KLRVQMRAELIGLHKRLGVTTIYVTHDQTEAMTLGDRVVVLKRGSVQQVDTPERLYRNPCNTFVAGFLGSPAMNLLHRHVGDDGTNDESEKLSGALVARLDASVSIAIGDRVQLTFAQDRLRFFDPASGDALAA